MTLSFFANLLNLIHDCDIMYSQNMIHGGIVMMEDLYVNIKKYRVMRGLSQEELALKTGYNDRSSIAKIEAGKVNLPADKILKFANALEVTYSELTGWTYDENGVPSYARNLRTSEEMVSLIKRGDYTASELVRMITAASEKLEHLLQKN